MTNNTQLSIASSAAAGPAYVAMAAPGLIAIERDEARVFRSLAPGTEPVRILAEPVPIGSAIPFGPPHPPSAEYLEAVAQTIGGETGVLLVYGSDPNAGTEVNGLMAWFEAHHPEIAARVVHTHVVPDRFWSNNRLLTHARNHLATQTYSLSTG